jgi:glycerol kinase
MVVNQLLMQFQADILNREVVRPVVQETTALGAAYAAGLAVGFFSDLRELSAKWAVDRIWKPTGNEAMREQMYSQWKKAVARSFDWTDS